MTFIKVRWFNLTTDSLPGQQVLTLGVRWVRSGRPKELLEKRLIRDLLQVPKKLPDGEDTNPLLFHRLDKINIPLEVIIP